MISLTNHDSSEVAVRSLKFAQIYIYIYIYIKKIVTVNSVNPVKPQKTTSRRRLRVSCLRLFGVGIWRPSGREGVTSGISIQHILYVYIYYIYIYINMYINIIYIIYK